jgi:hypothetical protein
MMVNLDMLINNAELTNDIKKMAVEISDSLKIIIEAAAEGDF